MNKRELQKYIAETYNTDPDFPWESNPTFAVYRHRSNKKWFALVANVPRSILKIPGDGDVDIINVKTSDADFFRDVKGFLPAYHMNKNHWVTVLLDESVPIKNIQNLIEMSYRLTE